MNTVKSWKDINHNILTLEHYRMSPGIERDFYVQLMKRGTCFVAYEHENEIHFSPSRFIGYIENNIHIHKSNSEKDGRTTNGAINRILKETPEVDGELEFRYKMFCKKLGFTPSATGTYGAARKYWFSPQKSHLLTEIFNSSTNDKELIDDLKEIDKQSNIETTEKQQLISARVGQGWFRENLIKYWKGCAVTKCDVISILRASHIKPWRYSSNHERLDMFNGLLLTPNLDLLFDKGFICFGENGEISISKKITEQNLDKLGISPTMKIEPHKEHLPYLNWHRKNIFKN